jgi:hypothetical protein
MAMSLLLRPPASARAALEAQLKPSKSSSTRPTRRTS